MFRILFYGGFALSALMFITAAILFFAFRIPRVIAYFSKFKGKSVSVREMQRSTASGPPARRSTAGMTNGAPARRTLKPLPEDEGEATQLLSESDEQVTELLDGPYDEATDFVRSMDADATQVLDDNETQVLDDEGTQLLDDDETTTVRGAGVATEVL